MILTVGDEFPDLELTDFRQNRFSLSDYRGSNNVLLVFLPEGFGFPLARRLLRNLHQHSDQLVDTKTIVIVMSQNTTESFERYWGERGLDFVGVPDPDYIISSSVAQLVILLDRQGMVRFLNNNREIVFGRITVEDVLASVDI